MVSSNEDKPWLEKRTRLEKYFMVACSILAIVVVLLIIGLSCRHTGSCENTLCLTPKCVATATTILKSLDKNVDPCNDFYQFACGNTIMNTVIPGDQIKVDSFNLIDDKIREQLHTILEKPIEEGEIKPITLVKKFYQACMNEDLIDKQGSKYLLDLYEMLGGWPVLKESSWDEQQFEWTKLMYDFRKLGFNTDTFVELTVNPDPLNSSVYIVELDQPSFVLGRDLLLREIYNEIYFNLMVDVAVQLGANRTIAEEELKEALDFEINLANISLSSEQRRNITKLVTHMSIGELKVKYSKTPWLEFINTLLLREVPLMDNDVILVVAPSYFVAFEKLIEETPKRVQANYAFWRSTQQVISLLPKDVYQHILKALKLISGQEKRAQRRKECSQATSDNLPLLVSSLYVRKYFDKETKQHALEMVHYLKDSFKDILKNLDWMDEDTRQKALDKANNMTELIGFPDELLNDTLLEKHYDKLETYEDQYLKSYLNIKFHNTNFDYNQLNKPVNKTDWTKLGDVATAAASYRPLENSIFFAAGILQGIFFNKDRPHYMNFGAIGTIIGHEITHGFDDRGRQFDGHGNLINWWNPKTEQAFLNKTQCIIYQYGNYTVPEINVNINGLKTQGENIADNGGLKEAYLAYNSWVENNQPELKLPGLEEFSPHQLFWISVAMNWCTKYKPEALQSIISEDLHSPNPFRVLGPFSNSIDFAKDFNCPNTSRMNPVNKCGVW